MGVVQWRVGSGTSRPSDVRGRMSRGVFHKWRRARHSFMSARCHQSKVATLLRSFVTAATFPFASNPLVIVSAGAARRGAGDGCYVSGFPSAASVGANPFLFSRVSFSRHVRHCVRKRTFVPFRSVRAAVPGLLPMPFLSLPAP